MAAAPAASRHLGGGGAAGGPTVPVSPDADCSLSRNCATAMSATRSLRSFFKHRSSSVRRWAGVPGGNALQSGSLRITAVNVSRTSSPGKAVRPVSIS